MRISYKTHPALKYFLHGDTSVLLTDKYPANKANKIELDLLTAAAPVITAYKGKINVISNAFSKAVQMAHDSLLKFISGIMDSEDGELSIEDLFIRGDAVIYIKIQKVVGIMNAKALMVITRRDGFIDSYYYTSGQDAITFTSLYKAQLSIDNGLSKEERQQNTFYDLAVGCVFSLFKQYAKVELHEVCKQKKERVPGEKEPIFNELDRSILHLNSSWWTEIVRNAAFSVRGHFRLQPKKNDDGEWTRELIWINPFVKHGYHRRPQKEIEGY